MFCPPKYNQRYDPHPSLYDFNLQICYISEYDCMQSHVCEKNYWKINDAARNDKGCIEKRSKA